MYFRCIVRRCPRDGRPAGRSFWGVAASSFGQGVVLLEVGVDGLGPFWGVWTVFWDRGERFWSGRRLARGRLGVFPSVLEASGQHFGVAASSLVQSVALVGVGAGRHP